MPIEIKMPALSPTMEEGTLAKWLVKEGDSVKSGDIMAEIETDKATMEFEAVDEGTIQKIVVAEGTDGVKVGAVIAILAGDDEDGKAPADKAETPKPVDDPTQDTPEDPNKPAKDEAAQASKPTGDEDHGRPASADASTAKAAPAPQPTGDGQRVKASPLARRIAAEKGIELGALTGSGPGGRVIKADVEGAKAGAAPAKPAETTKGETKPTEAAEAKSDGGVCSGCCTCRSQGGLVRREHSALGREALQCAQDDRPAADRIEADDPAHLPDGRCAARRAAEVAWRPQQGA